MTSSVLVTGAGGFIGGALVRRLQLLGVHVVGARNIGHGPPPPSMVRSCSAVIHLANIAHARAAAGELELVNVKGTRAMAEQAAAAGVKRFVYLSSIKVHGHTSAKGGFRFDSPIRPLDAYGAAKARAELALDDFADRMQITILRPPLVYGPGVKANFLALLRAVAKGVPLPFGSIRNRRSLVYVENLVDAIVHCLESPPAGKQVYTVSDGPALSTPELCRALGVALGRPARLVPCPPALLEAAGTLVRRRSSVLSLTRSLEVDDSDFRRDMRWTPPFSLEHGLQATAQWYLGR